MLDRRKCSIIALSVSILDHLLNLTMDIDEVQYLSENELISVVPNFKHPEIHLIRGSVGPFLPLVPLQVPMWMVCSLLISSNHFCF